MSNLPPGLHVERTRKADLAELQRLWDDPEVMRWVGYPEGMHLDEEALRRWLDSVDENPDRHHFVVRDDELGFCGELYYDVDRDARRAALDIKLLPSARGRGIATAALGWLIDLAFGSRPDVDLVWTEPALENEPARRLYKRCGLRPHPRPADLEPWPSFWALARADWRPD